VFGVRLCLGYTTTRARVEAGAALEQAEELRRVLEELGSGCGNKDLWMVWGFIASSSM
jgi:hypothetical protein